MRRRTFVVGTLLATAAAATLWRARTRGGAPGQRLPDGRWLVEGAGLAFGTRISIAAVHDEPDAARAAIGDALAEARRVDTLMTVHRAESQVGRLNATGLLLDPDPHLVRVLRFSQRLAALSTGTFDVTVQPLWRLHAGCRREGRVPSPREIAEARALVDWRALEVGPDRIALGQPGMAITLNGVAQGYAADLALARLGAHGIRDALLDTGEHGAAGERQRGQPWTLGIQHPRDPAAVVAAVAMDGRFLATSGDYATPFTDDLRSHHILDPRTGRSPPALAGATVAAASGMEADALTKPMMVLDLPAARRLLAAFPGSGAVWIDKDARIVATHALRVLDV